MRNLIITREKSFVACMGVMKVYIEDRTSPEITINDTPCRKLGTLKNGEQKSFPIDNTGARIFVIADKLSKSFCNEFFDVPAGDFDVALKGKNHYNVFAGNPFRFEGIENEEVLANRKKTKRKSYIFFAVVLIISTIIGFCSGYFGEKDEILPKTFTREGMSITLTDEFIYVPQDDLTACYGNGDYTVLAIKEETSLFPANTTLEDYVGFVLTDSPDIEVFDYEGLIFFEYISYGDDGTEYAYFATVFEAEDAFWLIQFAVVSENFEEAFPLFVEWAKTITFE